MSTIDQKILVVASLSNSLVGFRKPLLLALIREGLQVHVAAPALNSTIERKLVDELRQYGIITHDIDMQRTGINPLRDLKTLLALFSLINKIKPDITLGYTVKPVIYGVLASWLNNTPKRFALITGLGYAFQDSTSNNKKKIIKILVQSLYRFSLIRSSGVFFQNPDDELLFRELKILSVRTPSFVVNGSGVDINEYPFTPIKTNKIRFLFIGRLLKDKGIREFVEAACSLKAKYPQVEIDLVGSLDTNPESVSQTELDDWVERKIINYFGQVDDVRPLISNASVFVLPSYREGTPRSTLEALSMGRAIITTDTPGCRETVINGENGFLVPIKDTKALEVAMENFIHNPSLITSMGQHSRKIAEDKYDVNKVNQEMLKGLGLKP